MEDIGEFSFESYTKEDSTKQVLLPKNIGQFIIQKTKLCEDIFLFKYDHHIHKEVSFNSINKNIFHIQIVLTGDTYHQHKLTNCELNVMAGHTMSSFVNEEKNLNMKKKDTRFQSIGIVIKDSFLQKNFFDQLKNTKDIYAKPITIFKNAPTNIKTQMCANELFNSPYTGALNHLYKESKVLEIIYHEFGDILNNQLKDNDKIKLDDYDIEALYQAREILINNMQNPPSINALSKLVHLNELKLKVGFKQKFNLTPYKLLTQYRMQKAKELLETGDMNIYEVSHCVGYKHQSNFTKVFIGYFGIQPKELMKSRKYYH